MRKLLILLLLLFPSLAAAQYVRYDGVAIGDRGTPVAGASIAVCTQPASTGTQPCSPLASLFSTTSGTTLANPVTADQLGNYHFYAAPGLYTVQIYSPQISPAFVQSDVLLPCDRNPSCAQWAGPGATPTIDQAVTTCGANPCTVYISTTYSGPESTNLFTTSLGYKVYSGANNITIVDLRANPATPGNPGAAPLYPMVWGGREAGSLQRLAVNNWTDGTIPDSTGGASFFNWISGTFPTDNGQLAGSYNIGIVHDAVTVGASTSVVSGSDHEIHLDATSSDGPIPYAAAVTAQALISRTNATQNVTTAADYRASVCQNSSTSGAAITNCYGFDAPISGVGAGSTRNYGFHDGQGTLYENNLRIDAVDNGGTPRHFIFFRGDNGIDFQPLADASGWTFKTQGGVGAFRIIPNSSVSSLITHTFNSNINFVNGLGISATAPTIAAAGCGGGAASIVISNSTAAFKVNVGTTPGSACTITMPAATTGWNCFATDITTNSTSVFLQKQTGAENQTSVVITNFNDVGVATAFVGSDILKIGCFAD